MKTLIQYINTPEIQEGFVPFVFEEYRSTCRKMGELKEILRTLLMEFGVTPNTYTLRIHNTDGFCRWDTLNNYEDTLVVFREHDDAEKVSWSIYIGNTWLKGYSFIDQDARVQIVHTSNNIEPDSF